MLRVGTKVVFTEQLEDRVVSHWYVILRDWGDKYTVLYSADLSYRDIDRRTMLEILVREDTKVERS